MPPKKKVAALVKVALQAGSATPAPPVGTALGPHGVEIATMKLPDLNANDVEAACKIVEGTARSMGVTVE